ncbi:MAG: LEA type 2 family protein [Salinivirgaceae bacterium]|nr:LEA type 2 family protein [Salinivirgaceae bacterium]
MKVLRKLFMLAIAMLMLQSCGEFKDLELVTINSVNVNKVKLSEVVATVELTIHNPNSHKVVVYNADLDLLVDNKKIGTVKVSEKIIMPAKKDAKCKGQVTILNRETFKVGSSLVQSLDFNKLKFKIKGDVQGKYLIRKTLPVELELKR